MLTWQVLLLTIGLHFRLTRLITEDTITQPLRDWSAQINDWLGKLLDCGWCSGVWIAAGLVPLAWFEGDTTWYQIIALAGSISWLYGIAHQWLDEPPPDRTVHLTHHGQIDRKG